MKDPKPKRTMNKDGFSKTVVEIWTARRITNKQMDTLEDAIDKTLMSTLTDSYVLRIPYENGVKQN